MTRKPEDRPCEHIGVSPGTVGEVYGLWRNTAPRMAVSLGFFYCPDEKEICAGRLGMRFSGLLVAVMCSACGVCGLAFPQERGEVRGMAVDEYGSVVAGATVVLGPSALRDTTDAEGRFRFPFVPAGRYTLTASMPYLGLRDARAEITVPVTDGRDIRLVLKTRAYDVDEVVATAAPITSRDEERPAAGMVTVVESAAFEGRARTVADVVAETPGAVVRSAGGMGDRTEVSLRGANADQVQVYLDGMLLNEAVGGAVDLATVPLGQVRSIEVWRSGAPARFGGGAAGGVVNIRTRDFSSPGRMLSFGAGSFGTYSSQALFHTPIGSSRLLVAGGYSSSDNDFRFESDNGTSFNPDDDFWTSRKNDAFRSGNVLAKYRMLLGESSILELSEHVVSNDKELPGRDIVQNSRSRLATTRSLAQAKLTVPGLYGGRMETEPVLSHMYTREHYRDPDGSVGWGVQNNLYRTHAFRFILPVMGELGRFGALTVTPGAERESYRPDHKLETGSPLSCDRTRITAVADASLKFLGERLALSGNATRERLHSTFEGQPSPFNRVTPKPDFTNLTNLHAGFRWAAARYLSFTANWSDVTRAPGFTELFGDRGTTVSNPDLKPERTFRRDAGVRLSVARGAGALSREGAYFSNNNRNLIQWYTNDAGFLFPANVAGSYVRGAEIVWSGRLWLLSFSGSRTFQSSKVTGEANRIYRGKKLPNRPERHGVMTWELRLPHVTPSWTIDSRGAYYLDRANQAHKRYPGRTIHDIGMKIDAGVPGMRVFLNARNIGDVHTFDTQGMPLPGRSFMASVSWTVGKE